jgi:membrane protein
MARLKKFVSSASSTVRRWIRKLPAPFAIVLEAIRGWSKDDVPRLGASLAYYTLFSIAPILLVAVAVAGAFFGAEAVRGQVGVELQRLLGNQGAQAIEALLAGAALHKGGTLSTVVGAIAFVGASTGAFLELQHALNTVFKVKTDTDVKFSEILVQRLKSFGLVLTIGFLLMVSLLLSTGLSALSQWLHAGEQASIVWQVVEVLVSLGVITSLFAMIYRFLPDVRLKWRNIWLGAFVTASLFTVGKFLIGLYLGHSAFASSYGAIGSVLILLVWVYYSAQLILLGAEITRIYSEKNGEKPPPDKFGKQDRKARPSVKKQRAGARVGTT